MKKSVNHAALLVALLCSGVQGAERKNVDDRPTQDEVLHRANKLKQDPRWQQMTPLERERWILGIDESRRIKIAPVRPSTGIATGLVIAYGHVIKPPFQVELKSEKYFINGVQVIPSLIWERELKKQPRIVVTEAMKAKFHREDSIRDRVAGIHRAKKGKVPQLELQDEIITVIQSSSDVFKNARWANDHTILAEMVESGFLAEIELLRQPEPSKEEQAQRARKREELSAKGHLEYAESIRDSLKRGQCLAFPSSGGIQQLADIRSRVNEIMQRPGLARKQRIELLKEGGSLMHSTAEDIVDNYDPAEWGTE